MIDLEDLPPLRCPVVLAGFQGWNDAAEAASAVIRHLAESWEAVPVAEFDPENYYDLQVNRPRATVVDGVRKLTWPTTTLLVATPKRLDQDVILVDGIEPSMRWRSFSDELLDFVEGVSATQLVCMGSLLAEVPHTRPLPVVLTSEDPLIHERTGANATMYEGPTGILGILADAADARGIPTLSMWSSIPHYAASSHSAKASLALVRALEDALDWTLPHGDLESRSREWERGVDHLADTDDEIARYVRQLEAANDATDSPGASGDAIAREFERYLRGQDEDTR